MRIPRTAGIAFMGGAGIGFIVGGVLVWGDQDPAYVLALMSTGVVLTALALVAFTLLAAIDDGIKRMYSRFDTTNAVSVTEETRIVDSEGNSKETKGVITF